MEFAIRADKVGKSYQIYKKPLDRLKQSLWRGRRQYYEEFWALRGVSVEIKKGERIGIIGANGSGKSTLLQLISGIVRPTQGTIVIDGRVAALLELGAGFNPEFTGHENIYMNAAIMGLSKTEVDKRYDDIVAFANIGHFLDQPVKTYSSGMFLRLAFAVAVNVSPDILLVDEALAVGDARFQQKCMARIRKFCESGTVLLVSHDTTAITELCSRVLWIDRGEIRLDASPKRAVERYFQFMYEGTAAEDREPLSTVGFDCAGGGLMEVPEHADLNGFAAVAADVHQFGDGRVRIDQVRFLSPSGCNCGAFGEQQCEIGMVVEVRDAISNPIVGYMVKDRLGRTIFGDRHVLEPLNAGTRNIISFSLHWPNLPEGEYAISLALADGTVEDHMQCHLIHDALIVPSIPAVVPSVGMFALENTNCKVVPL